MLMLGFSTTTRVTPGGVGGKVAGIGSTWPGAAADAAARDRDPAGRDAAADAAPDAATPEAVVGNAAASVARSISAAACCTFSSVDGEVDGPGFRIALRSFCATSGSVSIKASASSLTDQPTAPRATRIAVSSRPALAARGTRQRSMRSIAGERA
jgi:hypothetical protein